MLVQRIDLDEARRALLDNGCETTAGKMMLRVLLDELAVLRLEVHDLEERLCWVRRERDRAVSFLMSAGRDQAGGAADGGLEAERWRALCVELVDEFDKLPKPSLREGEAAILGRARAAVDRTQAIPASERMRLG